MVTSFELYPLIVCAMQVGADAPFERHAPDWQGESRLEGLSPCDFLAKKC